MDFLLFFFAFAEVLSIHVCLLGLICSYGVLQVLPEPPGTYYSFKTERAALAQQPGTVQGRMLNTQMVLMHSLSPAGAMCATAIKDLKSKAFSIVNVLFAQVSKLFWDHHDQLDDNVVQQPHFCILISCTN